MTPATRTTTKRLALLLTAAAAFLILPCGCKKTTVPAGAPPGAGYTLIQQLMSRRTDLVDGEGRLVHRWRSKHGLASGARLLDNGDLIRTGILEESPFVALLPAIGGVVERLDWNGEVRWSFTHAEAKKTLHHDVEVLPNGNLLLIGVEIKSKDELLAAGRDPARMRDDSLWSDYLIEVAPTGDSGGKIVWEWHAWDHLVQDHDAGKRNHGVVSEHPELLDLNFIENPSPLGGLRLKLLQAVGYVGGAKGPSPGQPPSPEWTHVNSVAYHAGRDQIMLTVRNLGEIWIIDHSTSAAEAAGHSGGRSGRGGDLLYRWGNPQAYQRGKPADQKLFGPHNAHWIPAGLPGAGNVLIFNNGEGRRDGAHSAIEEIQIPSASDGSYRTGDGKPYGPDASVWRYVSEPKSEFYSSFLSGAQRLANGNTLVCSGMQRKVFEVDKAGRTVWSYDVKTQGDPVPAGVVAGNAPPFGGPPGFPGAPGGGKMPLPPLISILDINGDGFVDAAEIAHAPMNLNKLDRDGNGGLSIQECLPPPGGGPGGPPGEQGGLLGGLLGGPPAPPLPAIFTMLDSNGDRVIDSAEMARASSILPKLDRDGDGRISLGECLPMPPGGPPPPGSPGAAPGPGQGEEAIHGGLFRAVRFGVDHPAIKGRRLTPFGEPPVPPQPNR